MDRRWVPGKADTTSIWHLAQVFSNRLSMLITMFGLHVLILRTVTTLDHVDLELLAALASEPRATVVALAEKLGLSRNTVQARMGRLERSGVFLSYERALSPAALGFPIEAFLNVIAGISSAASEVPQQDR